MESCKFSDLNLRMMAVILNATCEETLDSLNWTYIDLAAVNSGNQIVLSGVKERLEEAGKLLIEKRMAKTFRFLENVQYAFHSRFMISAVEPFRKVLDQVHFSPAHRGHFVSNSGNPLVRYAYWFHFAFL